MATRLRPRHTMTPGEIPPLAVVQALKSAPPVTPAAPSPQGPGCSRGRAADLGLPSLHLFQGEHRILGCVPLHPGLQGLRHWDRAPRACSPFECLSVQEESGADFLSSSLQGWAFLSPILLPPHLAWLLTGAPSPLESFLFFFPPSYLVRSANSSVYSIPVVLSLNLKSNL